MEQSVQDHVADNKTYVPKYAEKFDFINMSKTYYAYSTHAPEVYGEATAMSLLGHALGPKVTNLIQPKAVNHNVYTLLDGESTWTHKTTAQELGQQIDNIEKRLPNEGSPEAILNALSRHPQGYWWMGEFSKILKAIKSASYLSGIAEVLNDMFNCPEHYVRELTPKGKNKTEPLRFEIQNAYLSVHTTITPDVLLENTTLEMVNGGLFARFLIVHGTAKEGGDRKRLPSDIDTFVDILRSDLRFIEELDKDDCAFVLSDEALEYYNTIEKELSQSTNARAFAGRYLNYVISFADIYLVSEAIGIALDMENLRTFNDLASLVQLVNLVNNNAENCTETKINFTIPNKDTKLTKRLIVVNKKYVEKAWKFIKPCLEYAKEIVTYVDMDKKLAKVRRLVKDSQIQPVNHSKVFQNSNLYKEEFEKTIKSLEERGDITTEIVETQTNGRKYRYIAYRWNAKPKDGRMLVVQGVDNQ